ncbi:uncharacterized protein K452DRAFT_302706 [Aplosporella prunicola CBS 121167]|uniref:DUF427 domain-containing protein n=1 Tax=Aplosporella prunicola CBS 121167 TaxID=1176127 RepID=A0A6A6AX41_9PEZI|nr:uncharacterized protein K452DRAFT_302706 [Aplosporella prunicola CBS 121167]KAF2136499.1 hypothetical protein K452DRAFT_302706 [Aplosporella prunicola CBS 121167]
MPPQNTDLPALAHRLLTSGPHRTLPVPGRRIRIQLNDTFIADTTAALLVWEHPYYPFYYVPLTALREGCFRTLQRVAATMARVLEVRVGERATARVLAFDAAGTQGIAKPLHGMVRVEFAAADAWFVEDEQIHIHPKDPFKRVECVRSGRDVVVSLHNTVLARSSAGGAGAVHLYETGLPTRFYLPLTAVSEGVRLRPSETVTSCPYKGDANYYDVVVGDQTHKDLVWWYKCPTVECAAVAGLVCFYNEKVDIEVGGVRLERPVTPFS